MADLRPLLNRARRAALVAAGAWAGCAPHLVTDEAAPLPVFLRPDLPAAVAPSESDCVSGGRLDVETAPSAVISLPEAVAECVQANLRIRAGAEKVQQARAVLRTAGTIPNPEILIDGLMVPLVDVSTSRQSGPPQTDAWVYLPVDWLVFGKRVAAMHAARAGVDVAAADFADLIRQRVADTVAAYYDVLESKTLLELTHAEVQDLGPVEAAIRRQVAAGRSGTVEADRAGLALADARREVLRRESAFAAARARLAPLLGRVGLGAGIDVSGTLEVTTTIPPPDTAAAIELAERHRPDLESARRQMVQTEAEIAKEQARGKPVTWLQTGFTTQHQRRVLNQPDATSYNIALNTTLPFTDRNQGNVDRARSAFREATTAYQAARAEIQAEIEQAIEAYRYAVSAVAAYDPAATDAARRIRASTEAALQAGTGSPTELLDAIRGERDRLRAAAAAKADYWRALARLNAAVGVGLASQH